MRKTNIDMSELKKLIRQSVKASIKEVLHAELMKMKSDFIPYISDAEQKEIEETYGKPENSVSSSIEVNL